MKILKRILDKVRPGFEENGRFSRFHNVFQAMDNFLFAAPLKVEQKPFVRDPLDVKRYMSLVITALVPCLIASVYFFGWRILLLMIVSYVVGGAVEVLFAVIRKEEVNEGFLVTGFIFPLILPPGLPLWIAAVGILFGVLVGKEVFGGTGRNLFNPALVGRLFVALGYPAAMTANWIDPAAGGWGRIIMPIAGSTSDAVSSATPLVMAKSGVLAAPLDLFVGRVLGSAGETSALAIILGGVFLLIVGVASWRTVVGIILSFAAFNGILQAAAPDLVAPLWFNLLAGSFLFGTFFMATDPVSGPVTQTGKWAYGVLIGCVILLIRTFSGFVEGVMFAILLGNISAPLIDEVVIRARMRRYAREG
jgi:Na(+)-translocating NADH:ubiquinone oxidoreductase B subunit